MAGSKARLSKEPCLPARSPLDGTSSLCQTAILAKLRCWAGYCSNGCKGGLQGATGHLARSSDLLAGTRSSQRLTMRGRTWSASHRWASKRPVLLWRVTPLQADHPDKKASQQLRRRISLALFRSRCEPQAELEENSLVRCGSEFPAVPFRPLSRGGALLGPPRGAAAIVTFATERLWPTHVRFMGTVGTGHTFSH